MGWKRPLRTNCKNGHALTEENIYLRSDGERACRICRNASTEAWWAKQSPERQESRRLRAISRATKWNVEHPEAFKEQRRKQDNRSEVKEQRKKFYEETKSTVWRRYSHIKAAAKKLGRDFEITIEDYARFVRNNACFYCGGSLPVAGYGIDRLNNLIGYVFANCVPCCETCNEKKGRLEGLGFQYPRTIQLMMELLGNN